MFSSTTLLGLLVVVLCLFIGYVIGCYITEKKCSAYISPSSYNSASEAVTLSTGTAPETYTFTRDELHFRVKMACMAISNQFSIKLAEGRKPSKNIYSYVWEHLTNTKWVD